MFFALIFTHEKFLPLGGKKGTKKEVRSSTQERKQFRIPGENDLYLTLRASVL